MKGEPRPYWHVDVKWFFGILFYTFFCLTVFSYGLFTITKKENALNIMSYTIGTTFSQKGLDDSTEIENFKAALKGSQNGYVKPVPAFDVTVSSADIEGKTPRQIRLDFYKRIADPIYEGQKLSAQISSKEDVADTVENSKGLLNFFSRKNNLTFEKAFVSLVFASLIFLIALVFFSYRLGRLISPALVAIFVGLPNALFWRLVNESSKNISITKLPFIENAEGSNVLTSGLSEMAKGTLPLVSDIFYKIYLYVLLAGGVLVLLALLSHLVLFYKERQAPSGN